MSVIDDTEEIASLFAEDRNPRTTIEVARLIYIVDRRPALLYEQVDDRSACVEERVRQVEQEVDEMASRRPNNGAQEKLCEVCGKNPIAGNREKKCHSCSRKSWEGRQGVGGRLAARLEDRFQMERKQIRDEARAAITAIEKAHKAEMQRMEMRIRDALHRAETAERQQTVLQFLCSIAEEGGLDTTFSKTFRDKLETAVRLAKEGWAKA
jgi:hypothetical protein